MHFKDIGIIIEKKVLKENSSILSVFSQNNGLYSGVIKEYSAKSRSIYQIGNLVDFIWQARLHEHIGNAKCELIKSYTGHIIQDKVKLYAFNSLISLIKITFHERENHNKFFTIFNNYLSELTKQFNFRQYIKIELAILEAVGYALQLHECVVTQTTQNLSFVSPKSGKAVCTKEGQLYANKLLVLPQFLNNPNLEITNVEKYQALELTTYFFNRYFFEGSLPSAREQFINYITSTN